MGWSSFMADVEAQNPESQTDSESPHNQSPQSGRERILLLVSRTDQITSADDTTAMVEGMLDLMIEVTSADTANFFQYDPAVDELVITHVRGDVQSQYLIGMRLNQKQGFPGISLDDAKIMVVGNLPAETDWLRSVDPFNAARTKNVINLPVHTKNQSLGVVQLFNYQQVELDVLTILSNRLAMELERRKMVNATLRSNERLLLLVDMIGEVAGTLDRDQLLHLVTEHAARLVDAERSTLFLIDPATREMLFQVAYQPPDQGPAAPARPPILPKEQPGPPPPSKRPTRHSNFQEGEFSYFNRSTITVPLRNEPRSEEHSESRKAVLGGLMVLNKPRAAFREEDAQLMQILADQASTFLRVAEIYESNGELFLGVVKSLIAAIDAKDPYTQGHSQRVSDYSVLIAREMGYDETAITDIRIGSLLHDIGKIGIPDSILSKPGPLSNDEMNLIREHPTTGINILSQVKALDPMHAAIVEHHERLDGSGYPGHLTDQHISWMGRIVAVADVFDAMTSTRPYRKSTSIWDVLTYLREKQDILFDAQCVQSLDKILARSI
jgi:putative nucleotidyltransferase with HDIG domain